MDFSQIGVAKTTSCDGFVHPEHGPTDIVMHGITMAHEDYDALVAKHNPPQGSQRIYIHDDDEKSIEVANDPAGEKRRRKVLAAMVTGVDGLTGWEFSPKATEELFLRSDVDWLVRRWREHLESEGKPSTKPASKPKRGPKS